MKNIIICLIFLSSAVQIGMAQGQGQGQGRGKGQGPEQRAQNQERFEAQRVAFITSQLNLTSEESAQFWPIFNEYKEELQQQKAEIKPSKAIDTMTEEEASKWLETQYQLEADLIKLKQNYFNKLIEVTSAKQIAQLAQIEHEFNRRILERLKQGRGPGKN